MVTINRNPSPRELRQFAAIWLVAVGLLAWRVGHHRSVTAGWILAAMAVAVCLLGLAAPPLVRPVYLGLAYATAPIGWVVSYLLLGVVYFAIFTPLALVFRL